MVGAMLLVGAVVTRPAKLGVGMMGEVDGEVVEVRRFELHGVSYHDVAIAFPDGTAGSARLGPESVPENLRPGEHVLATKVANMIVSLRRPTTSG